MLHHFLFWIFWVLSLIGVFDLAFEHLFGPVLLLPLACRVLGILLFALACFAYHSHYLAE